MGEISRIQVCKTPTLITMGHNVRNKNGVSTSPYDLCKGRPEPTTSIIKLEYHMARKSKTQSTENNDNMWIEIRTYSLEVPKFFV